MRVVLLHSAGFPLKDGNYFSISLSILFFPVLPINLVHEMGKISRTNYAIMMPMGPFSYICKIANDSVFLLK